MRRLALALHKGELGERGGGREAGRKEIESAIGTLLPAMGRAPEDAGALLRRLVERSGLIVERRRDVLAFSHLTFQEYFAAQALATESGERSVSFLTHPDQLLKDWWREVILLYSGLQNDASDLLSSILSLQDSDGLDSLRIAALCLLESVQVNDIGVRQTLGQRLMRLRAGGNPITLYGPMSNNVIGYLVLWAKEADWSTELARAGLARRADFAAARSNADEELRLLSAALDAGTDIDAEEFVTRVPALLASKKGGSPEEAIELASRVVTRVSEANAAQWVRIVLEGVGRTYRSLTKLVRAATVQQQAAMESILTAAMEHPSWMVREAAATAYGELGAQSPDGIRRLVRLTTDHDGDVRYEATNAIAKSAGRWSDRMSQELSNDLRSEMARDRVAALNVWGSLAAVKLARSYRASLAG